MTRETKRMDEYIQNSFDNSKYNTTVMKKGFDKFSF